VLQPTQAPHPLDLVPSLILSPVRSLWCTLLSPPAFTALPSLSYSLTYVQPSLRHQSQMATVQQACKQCGPALAPGKAAAAVDQGRGLFRARIVMFRQYYPQHTQKDPALRGDPLFSKGGNPACSTGSSHISLKNLPNQHLPSQTYTTMLVCTVAPQQRLTSPVLQRARCPPPTPSLTQVPKTPPPHKSISPPLTTSPPTLPLQALTPPFCQLGLM
jgi:hypothetical protein